MMNSNAIIQYNFTRELDEVISVYSENKIYLLFLDRREIEQRLI